MKKIETAIYYSVKISGIGLLVLSTLGIYLGGVWALTGFLIVFGYYFLAEKALELIGVGSTIHTGNEFDFISPENPGLLDRYGVPFYAASQLVCLPVCFYLLTFRSTGWEMCAGILSLMFAAGSIGGLAGHDLVHSKRPRVKWLGLLTLTSMNYGHFAVSHLLGHHRAVGLRHDWSTAYYRESLYHFLYRAVVHGYRGAWQLENQRLRALKKSPLSPGNQMIQLTVLQALLTYSILHFGGGKMFFLHLAFTAVAITFLEIVNYVSHYGLSRETRGGAPVRISNIHSWESNNKVSNWFIFNTGKHCHHHRKPSAKNYELILAHENSMVPYGLQTMTIISLIPPLYFRVMDKFLRERGMLAPEKAARARRPAPRKTRPKRA